ncbi:MAG: hypothetical protein HY043_08420 [Verrucomicrobia bacterium]|nr:hypothetical protein [Verrucomicrobiota bacterium]
MTLEPSKTLAPRCKFIAEQLKVLTQLRRQRGKGKHLFGIERLVLITLSVFLMITPTMILRWVVAPYEPQVRKGIIEIYAVLKPVILLVLLWAGLASSSWVFVLAIFLLIELYALLLGIVLLREFWKPPFSYSRSLILLAFNFVEIIAAFAIFYIYLSCLKEGSKPVTGWSDALYFSAVTSATVGYGDITPVSGIGRIVATVQILASLGFMTMIVAHFVSNIQRGRTLIRIT